MAEQSNGIRCFKTMGPVTFRFHLINIHTIHGVPYQFGDGLGTRQLLALKSRGLKHVVHRRVVFIQIEKKH